MAEFACRTCRDTYSVEAGADGVGRMTYDPCPDCDPYDEDDDWWEDAVTRPIEDVVVVRGLL